MSDRNTQGPETQGVAPALLRVIDALSAASAICAAAALALLALTVIVDVTGRSFFNTPLPGALEVTAYWWMPIMILMAFGYTELRREHIKVTILLDALPSGMRRMVEGVFGLLAAGLLTVLTWHALSEALDAMEVGQTTSSSPPVSIWPFKFFAVAGVGMLALQMAASSLRQFLGLYLEPRAYDTDADVV